MRHGDLGARPPRQPLVAVHGRANCCPLSRQSRDVAHGDEWCGMQAPPEPRLLQALRAHRGEVTCVEAAGTRLATGADDRALLAWRWRRGAGWEEEARVERAHRYGVSALRWAESGAQLASGGLDGGVRVWTSSLRALSSLGAGRAAVRALCWAGRARLLAAHDCGAVRVWALRGGGGVLLAALVAHEGALHALATTPPHHALLLTACTTGVLKVFDLAEVVRSGVGCGDGAAPAPLAWHDGAHDLGALCARASPAGDLLATGGHDALVRLWHVESHGVRPGALLAGHGAAVLALSWASAGEGGALLASASLDRTARLWAPPACVHVLHAHARYLTCVALEPAAAYMLTGSNDKSVRMWSLGSLTLEDELEPPCVALEHFGVGDLEGIEPVLETSDELAEAEASVADEVAADSSDAEVEGSGVRRLWVEHLAHGPINCITAHDDWLATASSDGGVRVYDWNPRAQALQPRWQSERAHLYPATSVDAGGGPLLLSAGLDARACLWDVQSGVLLREVSTEGAGGGGGPVEGAEAGGGGVRGARLSPHRTPRLLLATDDGLASFWSIEGADTAPARVYGGHAEGAWCCAWAHDGRVAATGAAGGELRVLAPPRATPLCVLNAHEHGVQSCDFAPEWPQLELASPMRLLATGGGDGVLHLWLVDLEEEEVRQARAVDAHAGGVAGVRWGVRALLVTAGADGWARGWHVGARGHSLSAVWGARAGGAGGVLCAALLSQGALLACGTLAGELSVWRVPEQPGAAHDDDAGAAPALWDTRAVLRWLRENVTRVPGGVARPDLEAALVGAVRRYELSGARLLYEPFPVLMRQLGYEEDETAEESEEESSLRAVLRQELLWLRTPPPPHPALVGVAPHALLCPLTHRLLREPARAADGYTYERAALLDWLCAAEAAVSPISGRALRNPRVALNHALRRTLRAFLAEQDYAPRD